jgi:hypothetical protein
MIKTKDIADASNVVSARYTQSAGMTISVDTGFSVDIGMEIPQILQFVDLEPMDIPQSINTDLVLFSEAEITKLIQSNILANSILTDIWQDDMNDDSVDS